jgi:hypothetical protein
MPEPGSISISLDELRAVLSAVEEHPPASHVTVERHDSVVIAKWTWRPADAETADGGHGGGPAEAVIYRGEKVAEHVHHAP